MGGWNFKNHQFWWPLSFIISFLFLQCLHYCYIYYSYVYRYYNTFEPCALNVEFQHFMGVDLIKARVTFKIPLMGVFEISRCYVYLCLMNQSCLYCRNIQYMWAWIYIICGFDFINVIKRHDGFQVLGCVPIAMDLDKMTIFLQTCLYF
jgi:hypothetical protein